MLGAFEVSDVIGICLFVIGACVGVILMGEYMKR
jgi:hypothetical protein